MGSVSVNVHLANGLLTMFQDYRIAYLRRHVRIKETIRLSFLRESVAYILSQSARRIPHASATAQFDLTALVEYCKKTTENTEPDADVKSDQTVLHRSIRRRFSAFFLKCIAHTLHHVPAMNGFLDYAPLITGGNLYLAEDINLGFAVNTKHGLVKPIIRNPHLKDLETVATEMRMLTRSARKTDPVELFQKAGRAYMLTALRQLDITVFPAFWIWIRSKLRPHTPDPALRNVPEEEKLQVHDILGATSTITNIGMMIEGHHTVTVIVPPEVAVFGIGSVRQTPMVVDGKVVPRYTVTLCVTIDHRAFDGGEGFTFYHKMKEYVDNPALIYDWKPGDEI